MNIIKELQDIFREIFDDDELIISSETTADDIEDWDSLTHLQLIMQIEQSFNIKFTTVQLKNMPNVGAMVDAIAELKKQGGQNG